MIGWTCWPVSAAIPSLPIHTAVLDNGLRVIFRQCPAAATTTCAAFVQVNGAQERNLTAGIRQLIQFMIEAPAGLTSEPTSSHGPTIRLEGFTTRDYVELVMQCVPGDLAVGLKELRQRLFEAEFTAAQLEVGIRRLRRSLACGDQTPVSFVIDTLVSRLYYGQPGWWPTSGTFAATGAIGLNEARKFYQSHFFPNATTIAVAGPLDWQMVHSTVTDVFETVLPGPVDSQSLRFVPQADWDEPWHGLMTGIDTSVVAVGGRAPSIDSEDYPAAAVLTTLLGSGMGSRLYQVLREKRALAYTTEAGLTPANVCGYVYLLATCSASDIDTVQQLIGAQLSDIAQQGPQPDELQRAKRYVQGSFALNQQSSYDIAHYLGMFVVCGGGEGVPTYQRFAQLIDAVSSEDIQRVCQQVFQSPAVVILQATGPIDTAGQVGRNLTGRFLLSSRVTGGCKGDML